MKKADILFSSIIALVALQSYYVWLDRGAGWVLRQTALSQEPRPFVYRVLLPFLSRILAWGTHLDVVVCLMILYIASAVGMYFAFKYLYETFYTDRRAGIISFAFCMLVFLITLMETHVYDLATVAFFCLGAALIIRDKPELYLLVFPLITLNRETSLLLFLFWLVFEFRRLSILRWLFGAACQITIWIAVRMLTMYAFAGNPGSVIYLRLRENLAGYIDNPIKSLVLAAVFAGILWQVFRNWRQKPLALQTAFLVMLPVQVVLQLLAGYPFEVRVYAESLPFAFLLATWRAEEKNEDGLTEISPG